MTGTVAHRRGKRPSLEFPLPLVSTADPATPVCSVGSSGDHPREHGSLESGGTVARTLCNSFSGGSHRTSWGDGYLLATEVRHKLLRIDEGPIQNILQDVAVEASGV